MNGSSSSTLHNLWTIITMFWFATAGCHSSRVSNVNETIKVGGSLFNGYSGEEDCLPVFILLRIY